MVRFAWKISPFAINFFIVIIFFWKLLFISERSIEEKLKFNISENILISNVTAKEIDDSSLIRDLLVRQIESRVKWRESINYMIKNGVNNFIEIGPGKVLSGLVKRIDKKVKVSAINNEEDINKIEI